MRKRKVWRVYIKHPGMPCQISRPFYDVESARRLHTELRFCHTMSTSIDLAAEGSQREQNILDRYPELKPKRK